MNEDVKKKAAQDWEKQVEKEKQKASNTQTIYHEPNFTIFLSSLSIQAMIAIGKMENPVTGKTERNLEQSRFLIDTLGIIKEKTKGNLTTEENSLLDDALYNLRLLYVEEKEKTV